MASTKISALTAATTLTGAESIPVVQGGVTKKVTTDQFLIKDASGNLGLGTTPSAWGSYFKAIQVGSYAAFAQKQANATAIVASNAYNDDNVNWRYTIGSVPAARYETGLGESGAEHRWYTAPSGTAGNPISFTQAMTLDASGNFGLGVTPSAWSDLSGGKAIQLLSGGLYSFSNFATGLSENSYYANGDKYIVSGVAAAKYLQNAGTHTWYTAPSGTAGNPISFTQAMALNASGVLTLTPNTSQAALFNYSGGAYTTWQHSGTSLGDIGSGNQVIGGGSSADFAISSREGNLVFGINGAERARIDASGNLLVGTTSPIGGGHSFKQTAANVASFYRTTSTGTDWLTTWWSDVDSTLALRAVCLANGNFQNTNNSYGSISDAKLKENITDASPKLAKLMQVRIVNYNLKADPDKTKLIGVVAQELEKVSPGLIEETADRDAEGNDLGTTTKSVKYSVFVPMLIKSLQEQQVQIDAQQAQLDALMARLAAAGI